jgi:hypothetical protein
MPMGSRKRGRDPIGVENSMMLDSIYSLYGMSAGAALAARRFETRAL